MSGRRTSGSSRPSLGVQVLAVFSFFSLGNSQFEKCLGEHLEVPDILLPDIRGLLTLISYFRVTRYFFVTLETSRGVTWE